MCERAAIGERDELGEGVGSSGTAEERRVSDLVRAGGAGGAWAQAQGGRQHGWVRKS